MADTLTLLDRVKVWRATGCSVTLSGPSLGRLVELLEEQRRSSDRLAQRARADRRVARLYFLCGVLSFLGAALVKLGGAL